MSDPLTPASSEQSTSVEPESPHLPEPHPSAPSAPAKSPNRSRAAWWPWLVGIAGILAAELYVYGHDGWVRVCVGRDGLTDLTMLDRPRPHDGIRGFPICAEHLNLGMYSRSDDAAREALDVACARGATLLRGEKADCLRKDHGWLRRVDKKNIPPWDPRLYRRLFFVD